MAKQRNVQQQNAQVRQRILEAAVYFAGRPAEMAWLEAVLCAHGQDPDAGILATLDDVPDQAGWLRRATWLTHEREFLDISVVLSYDTGELIEVEAFRDVTASTSVQPHMPGTGASFGWLAVQVLEEMRGGGTGGKRSVEF